MCHIYYSRPNELLYTHLQNVAKLCGEFTSEFTSKELGELLGWLHDAGKMTNRFQNVLKKQETNVNHAVVGSLIGSCPGFDKILHSDSETMTAVTDVVLAHHSEIIQELGMKMIPRDWNRLFYDKKYAVESDDEFKKICSEYLTKIKSGQIKSIDYVLNQEGFTNNLQKMLFVRMLLSCLVDADYSSVASFYNKNYLHENTYSIQDNIDVLINKQQSYKQLLSESHSCVDLMQTLREYVYNQCIQAANLLPGLFTLTAPTGTAKTMGMLSFALNHAKKYNKKRIIVVLPYLSIIDQQVKLISDIFGKEYIIEDDSQVECNRNDAELVSRWTAPIIVSTMVKTFETMFANNVQSLRKLHNLNNSVILIDEYQSIPPHVLNSTMETLKELTSKYGCTVLLASATPPDYANRKGLEWWNTNVKEIIQDVPFLYKQYEIAKKMNVNWNTSKDINIDELVKLINSKNDVGCIVNTKSMAQKIYEKLDNAYLISTNLCSAHRSDNIAKIKFLQSLNKPVRVISTQCIEAGVDISFTNVFRELAPLQGIVQSAGRCNRNGNAVGNVTIFSLQGAKSPDVDYHNSKNITKSILPYIDLSNLTNIDALCKYYARLYQTYGFEYDSQELVKAINQYKFKDVNEKYNIIKEKEQINLIVPYPGQINKYDEFVRMFNSNGGVVSIKDIKSIKTITVSTHKDVASLFKQVLIKTKQNPDGVPSNYYLLVNTSDVYYDEQMGLQIKK